MVVVVGVVVHCMMGVGPGNGYLLLLVATAAPTGPAYSSTAGRSIREGVMVVVVTVVMVSAATAVGAAATA